MFRDDLRRLRKITESCREDMHEPDEQGIVCDVKGNHLDNSMGDDPMFNYGEYTVLLRREGKDEWFNLSNLIALARLAKI